VYPSGNTSTKILPFGLEQEVFSNTAPDTVSVVASLNKLAEATELHPKAEVTVT
jgi:hypothetical protein